MKQHNFIIQRMANGKLAKHFPLSNGRSFEAKGKLIVNNVALVTHACLMHQGIMYQPNHIARPDVEQGKLVHLFLKRIHGQAQAGWFTNPRQSDDGRKSISRTLCSEETEQLSID
ncbi:hypothetical protein P4S72_27765 [Vibrio sp. PP-XX7]